MKRLFTTYKDKNSKADTGRVLTMTRPVILLLVVFKLKSQRSKGEIFKISFWKCNGKVFIYKVATALRVQFLVIVYPRLGLQLGTNAQQTSLNLPIVFIFSHAWRLFFSIKIIITN